MNGNTSARTNPHLFRHSAPRTHTRPVRTVDSDTTKVRTFFNETIVPIHLADIKKVNGRYTGEGEEAEFVIGARLWSEGKGSVRSSWSAYIIHNTFVPK